MSESKIDFVKTILEMDNENVAEEEELMHLLLQQKVSKNINKEVKQTITVGQKMADNIARFAGSWTFITGFAIFLIIWIVLNSIILKSAYDPYPFILLNLMLSCIAAIQAPVIMMSQNRQEEKDRIRSRNDYKVNLKSEIIIEDLHRKIDQLMENQEVIMKKLKEQEK